MIIQLRTICLVVLGTILITAIITASNNINSMFTVAQGANRNIITSSNLDTFHAKGTVNSMTSDVLAGTAASSSSSNKTETYILGGGWDFDVINGKLQNFKLNIVMAPIDGKALHFHSISKLNNLTAAIQPFSNSESIILRKDNFTGFKAIADVTTNGKPNWTDVPIEAYIIGGNIINIHINSEKTQNHFRNFPIYGIVTSITDANDKPIKTLSVPQY